MGEVVEFRLRPKKLTGFLPATLGVKPISSDVDPWTFWLTFPYAIWFADGWRDR
jgi:hypothetical protein